MTTLIDSPVRTDPSPKPVDTVARGQTRVAEQLDMLGAGWYVLKVVRTTRGRQLIQHVVIGPPGVFSVLAVCEPNGRAVVSDRRVRVNRRSSRDLRAAHAYAIKAGRLLSDACELLVEVRPVLVFVDLRKVRIKRQPTNGVHAVTRSNLVDWLRAQRGEWTPAVVRAVYAKARLDETWATAN